MRILVLSDSHGAVETLAEIVGQCEADMILHLGDHARDCAIIRTRFPQIMLRAVKGNCDRLERELDTDEFVVEGKRIVMTHGHLFGVKNGLDRVRYFAESREADILLFGHTHVRYDSGDAPGDIRLINPGSAGTGKKTFAALEIQHGEVICNFRQLEK